MKTLFFLFFSGLLQFFPVQVSNEVVLHKIVAVQSSSNILQTANDLFISKQTQNQIIQTFQAENLVELGSTEENFEIDGSLEEVVVEYSPATFSDSAEITQEKTSRNYISSSKCAYSSNYFSIPSLNICAPISYDVAWETDIYLNSLRNGLMHLSDTTLPGQSGRMYVGGHSSSPAKYAKGNFDTIFAALPDIHIGSEVFINKDEVLYKYVVHETAAVNDTDYSVIDQNTDKILMSIVTCYPIGTNKQRFVAFAELEK